jgi:hypothetical protein
VVREILPNRTIILGFVGHESRLRVNVITKGASDNLLGELVGMDRADLAAALNEAEHHMLVAVSALH